MLLAGGILSLGLVLPVAALAADPDFSGGIVMEDPQDPGRNSLFPDPPSSQSGNAVTLHSGDLTGSIYGGNSQTGDVYGNSATIEGGTLDRGIYGGLIRAGGTGNVYGNTVTVLDGTLGFGFDTVVGGSNGGSGAVYDNTAIVSGGVITGSVYGGNSMTGDVYGNSALVEGTATVTGDVYGGASIQDGAAYGNSVIVDGTASVGGSIYGGVSLGGGNVYGNSATLRDGSLGGGIAAGWTEGNGDVYGNSATVEGGSLNTGVYGGLINNPGTHGWSSTGNVYGNTVTVLGGTLGSLNALDTVVGGATGGSGAVYDNTAIVSGGDIANHVYGGYSNAGDAYGNSALMEGTASVGGSIYGGAAFGDGDVYGNSATMRGGSVTRGIAAGFSQGNGDVYGNNATFEDGTLGTGIYGGLINNPGTPGWSGTGNVYGNTATVLGGTLGSAGYTDTVVGGATAGSGSVYDNTAIVSGGSIFNHVFGGYSNSGDAHGNSALVGGTASVGGNVYGGASLDTGAVYGNSVFLDGDASVAGNVYGGYSEQSDAYGNSVFLDGNASVTGDVYGGASLGAGSATDNTVTVYSGANIANSHLYGGSNDGSGADVFTGNTLNFEGFTGDVAGISNFQTINVLVPASVQNGGTVVSADALKLGDGTQGTDVNVNVASGGRALGPGDSVTLIDADSLTGVIDGDTVQGMKGSALVYDFELANDPDAGILTAAVKGARVNPQYKALTQGRLAGLSLLNQGADMVAEQGLRTAAGHAGPDAGLSIFALGGGGSSRYTTGSHVDLDSFTMMVGAAWNSSTLKKADYGLWTAGAFFEAGWGDYNTRGEGVSGDGWTNYYGGGILGRYEAPFNAYIEASARIGHTESDFSSDDIINVVTGKTADYDSDSTYYGLHVGLGYILHITDKASVDFNTKYLWTRLEGDKVSVAGDKVDFDDADSQRWRTGARFSYTFDSESVRLTPYVGAAFEYEFDGEAAAKTYGYDIDAADLTGGTGVGEVGITVTPAKFDRFSADVVLQGYTGVREGVGGSLQLRYDF